VVHCVCNEGGVIVFKEKVVTQGQGVLHQKTRVFRNAAVRTSYTAKHTIPMFWVVMMSLNDRCRGSSPVAKVTERWLS
jgi:hypothetical protein